MKKRKGDGSKRISNRIDLLRLHRRTKKFGTIPTLPKAAQGEATMTEARYSIMVREYGSDPDDVEVDASQQHTPARSPKG